MNEINDILDTLDIDSLDPSDQVALAGLLEELDTNKKELGILDCKLLEKQQVVLDAFIEQQKGLNDLRYYIFWGGNGAGKTHTGAYITALKILGNDCFDLGLPYIGSSRFTIIGTESNDMIDNNIAKYLIGDGSPCRIPPHLIAETLFERRILKGIKMKNGNEVKILTYEQGYEKWQGPNPDFLWLDEEPKDKRVFDEAYARTRVGRMLLTMTPSGLAQEVRKTFITNSDLDWMAKYVKSVQSYGVLDNPYADQSLLGGMSADARKRKVFGSFDPPEGLVYRNFGPDSIVDHMNPSDRMFYDSEFYIGIDPGASHAFAVSFILKTSPHNSEIPNIWYQFDEMLFENGEPIQIIGQRIADAVSRLPKRTRFNIIDSASKQVGIDLKGFGIQCMPADKRSKLSGDENRMAGINHINGLLFSGNFFVSKKCKRSIEQYNSHYYKYNRDDGGKDGAVKKINDDLLDATRYVITLIDLFLNKRTYESSHGEKKDKYNTTYTPL